MNSDLIDDLIEKLEAIDDEAVDLLRAGWSRDELMRRVGIIRTEAMHAMIELADLRLLVDTEPPGKWGQE